MNTLQLRLNTTLPQEVKNSWAFAAKQRRSKRVSIRTSSRCIITAVSREARAFGVQAGMAIEDAKLLLPELKVFVYHR